MRGIFYEFDTFEALQRDLEFEEPEVRLPADDDLRDGQWLLATFSVGDESTSLAGRVADRGNDLRLIFEDRDWDRLRQFATGQGPVSVPPSSASGKHAIYAPPGTVALVVDDDPALCVIVDAMLKAAGVICETRQSAEEALLWLREHHADIVLLDWVLPGMNGIELCTRIRSDSHLCQLPVLFLTGHTSQSEQQEAFAAGADDFVSKPFRALELRARVLGLLRRARMPVQEAAG